MRTIEFTISSILEEVKSDTNSIFKLCLNSDVIELNISSFFETLEINSLKAFYHGRHISSCPNYSCF